MRTSRTSTQLSTLRLSIPRLTTPRLLIGAALAGLLLASCRSVEFYEKAAFSDPTMALDESRCEIHWYQKVFYSQEGSAGGIGTVAGGGCGCY